MKRNLLLTLNTFLAAAQLKAGTFDNPFEGIAECNVNDVQATVYTTVAGGLNSQFQQTPQFNAVTKVLALKIQNKAFLQQLSAKKLAEVSAGSALQILNLDTPTQLNQEKGQIMIRRSVEIRNQEEVVIQYARIIPQVLKCVKTKEVPFFNNTIKQCVESVEVAAEKVLASATLRLNLRSCVN